MGIEGSGQLEVPNKQTPVADKPIDKPVEKKEISPEKIKQAEETVLDTLGIESKEDLNNFDEKLKTSTKSLPKYQQIEKSLEGVDKKSLPYELFKILKKDSDDKQVDPSAPKDGVLIKSMKKGPLECAGRALIASTFLQEKGIEHVVVSAPGHSFIIIEQSQDTLAYFDANNNLFFTFPKSALEGYKDTKTSTACHLKEYTPRKSDFSDGVNTTFSHFVAMPAKEAIGRQYLGNVAAALTGNEEFETSGVKVDKDSSEAVRQIETEIYGENSVLGSFYSRVETLLKKEAIQTAEDKQLIGDILQAHPLHDDFVEVFTAALEGNIGDRIPYIKNASPEQKKIYAEKVWNLLQKRETIRGR